MFKKVLSALLVFGILLYTSPIAGFAASEADNTGGFVLEGYIGGAEEVFYAGAKEALGLTSPKAVDLQVKEDMVLLQSFYQPTEYMVAVEIGENGLRYTLEIPGTGTQAQVEAYEYGNGTRVLEVWEGDCHDILALLPDGTIVLNGHIVTITETFVPAAQEGQNGADAAVEATWVSAYATSPFAGTAAQYSTNLGTIIKNVNAGSAVNGLAVSVIATLVGYAIALIPGGAFPSAIVSTLFSTVAGMIKSKAEANAPGIAFFSFQQTSYQNNTHSSAVAKYYKYFVSYYAGKDLTYFVTDHTFYESYVLV